jgi:hypothetical protein
VNRRTFIRFVLLGGAVAVAFLGWAILRGPNANPPRDSANGDIRMRFVCCNDYGEYSPGVYLRVGGGQEAFDTLREAAPFMRAGDPGSAAAGLCGFLFKQLGYDGDTAGTLALEPPPEPAPDGTIDWKQYGGDGDVILINVDQGSARCCFGSMLGQEMHDLPLGGRKKERP